MKCLTDSREKGERVQKRPAERPVVGHAVGAGVVSAALRDRSFETFQLLRHQTRPVFLVQDVQSFWKAKRNL